MSDDEQASSRPVAIALLCKAPRPGLSKTRLIPAVGDRGSADLSRAFLLDVGRTVRAAADETGARAVAVFAPEDARPEIGALLPDFDGAFPQMSGSLGDMMLSALQILLSDHGAAILVGSDVPTVPVDLLAAAIRAVRDASTDVVIAPTRDGGYFLIGMRQRHRILFDDMVWSTDTVFAVTCARAQSAGLRLAVLPQWYDVDDAAALAALEADLEDGRACAPATRAALASLRLSV
jgi:rSAM/selenodomain-associated transferase 1